eukprot:7169160-Prymnesium_polylepis.1
MNAKRAEVFAKFPSPQASRHEGGTNLASTRTSSRIWTVWGVPTNMLLLRTFAVAATDSCVLSKNFANAQYTVPVL